MNKNFERHIKLALLELLLDTLEVFEREFPRHHNPLATSGGGLSNTCGTGDRHLG